MEGRTVAGDRQYSTPVTSSSSVLARHLDRMVGAALVALFVAAVHVVVVHIVTRILDSDRQWRSSLQEPPD